ncbi:hypothetical protein [Bradyrhizobium sp. 6(2017)]|uniref:hypothetical protein n=1 Tax=Bradyrhizobium sp. 6(2017) TaxID=1197460 RepID=UPI0013E18BB8|nr:hypothetical protein [Bradyrhizobium sp. 6(2017)]QIG91986.1 hypothetical protein G6P99_05360 [Bradyrhizobium sp. 6(2017)]
MKSVTRRGGLCLMVGAAAASTLLASDAAEDPALAAIAKHRKASADHLASIYAVDDTDPGTGARYDAEGLNEACCHAAWDAAWDLASTIPTTLAGIVAILQYANELEDAGEEWPDTDRIGRDGWHYRLRQTMAAAAVNIAAV